MGIGDVLDSAVKTPVTNALKSSYNLGSAAISKISNTIGRGNRVDENLMMESSPELVAAAVGKETAMGNGGERKRGGFRDVLGSAVGGLKTPVSNVLKSSYNLGSAVENLKGYMPGPEHQEKIGRAITHPATKEVLKLFVPPGGVGAYNVAATVLKNQPSTNVHDNKKFEKELKVLRDENEKMRADLEHMKNLVYSNYELNSSTNPPITFKSSSTIEQKPEEVISVFMMKGLNVLHFMDNQVVPTIRGPIDRA